MTGVIESCEGGRWIGNETHGGVILKSGTSRCGRTLMKGRARIC